LENNSESQQGWRMGDECVRGVLRK